MRVEIDSVVKVESFSGCLVATTKWLFFYGIADNGIAWLCCYNLPLKPPLLLLQGIKEISI